MKNPIHLVKGKLIDAIPGFVETFNWLVDSMKNLKGDGARIQVTWPTDITPMITYVSDDDTDVDDLTDPIPIEPIDPLDLSGIGGNVTVEGEGDNGQVTTQTGNTIHFKSGQNSNVKFSVSTDEDDKAVVTVDVYYK